MDAGEIHLPTHQPFVDVAAEAADHLEKDVRELAAETLHQRRHQEVAGGGRHREGEAAGRPRPAAANLRLGLLELAQRDLAALEQDAAGLGQADAMAVALEERAADLFLE